ncbi:hypothetical protein HG536_0H01470 [Torulaspora globosa]|uniref:Elongin-C n=1 Tax=Torulaspora globosa TaxID=48254 RepID=A0A7G3ZMN6_9SACH|nr:uncharacterized protein HG536_0H01470 [Torulaspora globosa]QLL34772.1 hypothetical protein HG536_0H01470 [Torulaspora globosa]
MSTVRLISNDNTEIEISREAASISSTLKSMLEGPFKESDGRIELPTFDSKVLQKVVEYLEYNLQYHDAADDIEDIPEFEIPTEMALELLLAADYLGI